MKKTFTDNLPKWQNGRYKGKINWKISINYEVNFIYDNIKGKVKIIDYDTKKQKISIKYKNKFYFMHIKQFITCQFGNILGLINHNYRYQVGDIITDIHFGKLEILEQIRIKSGKNKYTTRGYRYKCLICGNKDVITEFELNREKSCNVCSGHKVLIGYNDIWTTNPELAKLLADPNDGYKYTKNSSKRVNWKCPNCGNIIKNKIISQINRVGLSCPKCSDKLPYTEKFICQFLQQLLQDNFIYQLTKSNFKWVNKYLYDFYFKINNEGYILEIHGLQHYQESFGKIKSNKKTRSLEDEQKNDRNKKNLAIKNGIKEDNYIVIDCRESTLEWIKEHILSSKLNELFDLSKINWLECHKHACKNLVKQACDLWVNGMYSTTKIGKMLKLNRNTICRYLKQGTKLGWCKYDPKEVQRKSGYKNGKSICKKVICLNNKKIFNSIMEAGDYYNLKFAYTIGTCCKGRQKSAGKDPITSEKLKWMYYKEYLINKEVI